MKTVRSNRPKTAKPGKALRPGVVFSAGDLFFTHVTEWPEGVQGKDLAALAELALEAVSPFALESLAWGFTADAASRSLFLFAACLPRIDNAEQAAWQQATHVFPAFLPLLVPRDPSAASPAEPLPAFELLVNGGEVLLLERDSAAPWPRRIHSETLAAGAQAGGDVLAAEGTPPSKAEAGTAGETGDASSTVDAASAGSAAVAAALRLLVRCGLATDAQAAFALLERIPFWKLVSATDDRRGEVHFRLTGVGVAAENPSGRAAEKHTVGRAVKDPTNRVAEEHRIARAAEDSTDSKSAATVLHSRLEGEEACWSADLRSVAFIAQARRRHRSDVVWWRVLCGAAAAAAALLLLWLSFWGLGFLLKERQRTLAAQAPAVEKIRQNQDLLTRMRQFSADPFSPFSLFAGLKTGKPATIYFDSVELQRPATVTVDGQGPTVDAVNAYARSLTQSGRFSDARQARMSLRDGASVFTFYLQYLGEEHVAAVQAAAAQDSAQAARGERARYTGRRSTLSESGSRRGEIAEGIPDEAALAERVAALQARIAARRTADGLAAPGQESASNGGAPVAAEADIVEEAESAGMFPPDGDGLGEDEPPPGL